MWARTKGATNDLKIGDDIRLHCRIEDDIEVQSDIDLGLDVIDEDADVGDDDLSRAENALVSLLPSRVRGRGPPACVRGKTYRVGGLGVRLATGLCVLLNLFAVFLARLEIGGSRGFGGHDTGGEEGQGTEDDG